jgi:hypothetical protein
MRRRLLACIASTVLLPAVAAGSAMADSSGLQSIGQSADSEQSASSNATSAQVQPTNQSISVRIMSPGDDGAVTQTNASTASSAAGNTNTTDQGASQAAGGAGTQAAGQSASNDQSADSSATSAQIAPSNQHIAVRIMSPGDDGSVKQTNSSDARSAAGNTNTTRQQAAQGAGASDAVRAADRTCDGCLPKGALVQAAEQKASNDQDADSSATSVQVAPSNADTPVRIDSPGGDGEVEQTNASAASSSAGNTNATGQAVLQAAGGGGTTVQAVGQKADNDQDAGSQAGSFQLGASNASAGSGAVEQTNSSDARSAAGNTNATGQAVWQFGGGLGTTVQAVGQKADNDQDAESHADSWQLCPINASEPVRIDSPGGGGAVEQANRSAASSAAGNTNWTRQLAWQGPWGGLLAGGNAP